MATPIQFQTLVFSSSSSHLSTSHRSLPLPLISPSSFSHSHSKLTFTLTHQHQQFIPRSRCFHPSPSSASKHEQQQQEAPPDEPHVYDPGVKLALSLLHFYTTQISPLLPRSCRYVPTCSQYSILAFKKYGFPKGFILTACRICRCNPFGGYGFDPPRWFGEEREEPSSDL